MNASNSSREWKRATRCETRCSTRPAHDRRWARHGNCTTKARLLGSVGWDVDMCKVHTPTCVCVGHTCDLPVTGGEYNRLPFTNMVSVSKCGAVTALQCPNVIQYGAVTALQCPRASTAATTGGPMEQAHALTFDAFRLEPPPGGLCRGDTVIALRPRSLAVLRYLVMHAGRLVTKAELRQHVWGGTHVSDTVLRVCPGDSRRVGRHGGGTAVSRDGRPARVSVSCGGRDMGRAAPTDGRPHRRATAGRRAAGGVVPACGPRRAPARPRQWRCGDWQDDGRSLPWPTWPPGAACGPGGDSASSTMGRANPTCHS